MKKKIIKLLIFIIIFIGIFIRVVMIDKVPIALFGDEIDVGLQAYSILTTGNDYLGNRLPILFHSFSEYRLPMQLYLAVPSISLFGFNEAGVRVPSVLMGFLSLLFFYLLIKEISNRKVALIATIFMLFSPWHLNFARQANDAGILLPFILAGTWTFLKGLKDYRYLILSAALFALSIYSYAISSLFTPLLVLVLFIIYHKEILKHKPKHLLIAAIVGFIVLSPYINEVIKGTASSRFNYISIINKDNLTSEVIEERSWSDTPLSRFFYNKYSVAAKRLMNSYLKAFSADFLFAEGDPNQRQAVSGFGMFYHFDAILVLIGGYVVVRGLSKRKKHGLFLIILWLIIAPLPSILTKEGGTHSARLIMMLPPLIFLSANGFNYFLTKISATKLKIAVFILILFMVYDAGKFIHRYFVIWPNESWRSWQYGFKEVLTDVAQSDEDYSRIYFNNTYEPMLPRFLFWYQYDMELFQKQFTGDVHLEGILPGFNGFSLGDKYYFGELVKPIEPLAKPGHLVVASSVHDVTDPGIFERSDLNLINTYYSPTEIPIFYIYTSN